MLVLLLFCFSSASEILEFAEELEKQEDFYRAITEYKRFLYHKPETDSIRYRICSIYKNDGKYGNAIDVLREVKEKNESYKFKMGELFYRAGYYDSCSNYWNDEKMGLVYLRRGEIKKGMEILDLTTRPDSKSPVLGLTLSAIIPGTGRIYAGRTGDGIFSLLAFSFSSYLTYKYYKEDNRLLSGVFGSASIIFYLGNLFGSYTSVKIYNRHTLDKFTVKLEKKWLLY
jgi:tetratricopeptide (TPR) repeat protein